MVNICWTSASVGLMGVDVVGDFDGLHDETSTLTLLLVFLVVVGIL